GIPPRRAPPFHVEHPAQTARSAARPRRGKVALSGPRILHYDPARSADGPDPVGRARPDADRNPRDGRTGHRNGPPEKRCRCPDSPCPHPDRPPDGPPAAIPSHTNPVRARPRPRPPAGPRRLVAPSITVVVQERCAWTRVAVRSCFVATAPPSRGGSRSTSACPWPPPSSGAAAGRTSSATSTPSRSPRWSTGRTTSG